MQYTDPSAPRENLLDPIPKAGHILCAMFSPQEDIFVTVGYQEECPHLCASVYMLDVDVLGHAPLLKRTKIALPRNIRSIKDKWSKNPASHTK